MTEALLTPPALADLSPPRVSVPQYHRMIACGAIGEDDPVELLHGRLVETMPQGSAHAKAVEELAERCRAAVDGSCHVKSEKPITFADSEPEPDVAVVRGSRWDYEPHPTGRDCLLLIEVAETSLARDLGKARVYAAGGAAAYWVVDLAAGEIVAHAGPSDDGYAEVSRGPSAAIDLPGGRLAVSVGDLTRPQS